MSGINHTVALCTIHAGDSTSSPYVSSSSGRTVYPRRPSELGDWAAPEYTANRTTDDLLRSFELF